MEVLGYEVKYGKHITFKHKDKARFTRAKTIGDDYAEDSIKDRIANNSKQKTLGNIIDKRTNKKVQESKGYEYRATKHSLKTISDTVLLMREKGVKSALDLDKIITSTADTQLKLQGDIKIIESQMIKLSNAMEHINTINKYRQIARYRKENPKDKDFAKEYNNEIKLYNSAIKELKKDYEKLPDSKNILEELDALDEKKNTLIQEYSSVKSNIDELYKIRKNYDTYMEKI